MRWRIQIAPREICCHNSECQHQQMMQHRISGLRAAHAGFAVML